MPSSDIITLRAEERSAIIQIAGMITQTAKTNSAWSSTIPNAFSISEVFEQPYGLLILIKNKAPEARAFEFGSGLHATHNPPGYIIIAPRNASSLEFLGTHEWEGMWISVPPMGHGVVHHPGVAPRPFLNPAIESNRGAARHLTMMAVRRTVVQIMQEAWKNG